jgi:integrase
VRWEAPKLSTEVDRRAVVNQDQGHRLLLAEDTDDTKSTAGRRVIGLPAGVVQLLWEHKEVQETDRRKAAQLWDEGGWVFTTPTGRPLNPNTDFHEWKKLLRQAGVRDGRLHDARHTAATVLMVLGVQERAAMDVMGWATTGMAACYQHVTDPVRADIAQRVGSLIWKPTEVPETETEIDERPDLRVRPSRVCPAQGWPRIRDSNS